MIKKNIRLRLIHFKHTYKHYFAHHPLCEKYGSHTYKFGDVYLCKGCVHTYSGAVLFFVINMILIMLGNSWVKDFYSSFRPIVLMCFLLTSLMVDFFKVTVPRPVKNLLRQMLGYFIATAVLGIIYFSVWVKVSCFILAVVVYIALRNTRKNKRHNKCNDCEEFVPGETCSGFRLMIDREIKFSKEAGDYLQKKYYSGNLGDK